MNTKTNGGKVIFLDIDGVLNAYNYFYTAVYDIFGFFGQRKWLVNHFDVFGVRTYRVFLLWLIVKFTKADIVLSSSWRYGYLNPETRSGRQIELAKKLGWFGLSICDVTKRLHMRGDEIQTYLNEHPNIKNYVIIDDEKFDIVDIMGADHLVITSYGKEIQGHPYENTGLKPKDVIKAIKILNNKEGI